MSRTRRMAGSDNPGPKGTEKEVRFLAPDEIPYFDNVDFGAAPTLYVDAIRAAAVMGGVARLNLIEYKLDPAIQDVRARVVATIALPVDQLDAWSKYLANLAPTEE